LTFHSDPLWKALIWDNGFGLFGGIFIQPHMSCVFLVVWALIQNYHMFLVCIHWTITSGMIRGNRSPPAEQRQRLKAGEAFGHIFGRDTIWTNPTCLEQANTSGIKNHESNAKIDKNLPQKMHIIVTHSWKTLTHPNVSSCLVTHFFSTGHWLVVKLWIIPGS